MIFFFFLS